MESGKIGKRGAFVIPARLRRRYGLKEGSVLIAEEREDGILLRPGATIPVEIYTPERRAELLLANAANAKDLAEIRNEIRKMGLDPDEVRRRGLKSVR